MQRPRNTVAAAFLAALCVSGAHAAVISTLPYPGTPDWTDITFAGASMTTNGTTSTLSTSPFNGVWFGWGAAYGDQPAWSPGSPGTGNYLRLTTQFTSNAADWSAYFYDTTHAASLTFNPTNCLGDCYGQPALQGTQLWFGIPGNPTQSIATFLPMDLTQTHTFEFLLRGGSLQYRVDGQVYSGVAQQAGVSNSLLVIGDGSGSTATGVGSMSLSAVAMDTAPAFLELAGSVPEPSTLSLLVIAYAGFFIRRRPMRSHLGSTAT